MSKYYYQNYVAYTTIKVKIPDSFPDNPQKMTSDQIDEYKQILKDLESEELDYTPD